MSVWSSKPVAAWQGAYAKQPCREVPANGASSGTGERAAGRRLGQRGYVQMFGALLLFFILVPAAGLATDVGMMYLVKSLLSAASDGAALAGARALSRGSDDATQRANAEATANTYLRANFPAGYMWSTNLLVDSHAATDSQYVRSLTTTASVELPLLFLRIFRTPSTIVSASSKATRRDVNIMFVMDRSSSLQLSGSCQPLKNAAKNLIDKFAEGRDNLGLITFGTSSKVDNPLSTTFKTAITTTLNNNGELQRRDQHRARAVAGVPGAGHAQPAGRLERDSSLHRRRAHRGHRDIHHSKPGQHL